MRLFNASLLAVLICALPATALGQDNPTVGVSYWKCDWANLQEIQQTADSIVTPIYQEMVDEGTIMNWGMLTHQWGDSWNIVMYTTAADTPAYLNATQEANQRIQERHPDLTPLTDYCTEHKDNIYTLSTGTSSPE